MTRRSLDRVAPESASQWLLRRRMSSLRLKTLEAELVVMLERFPELAPLVGEPRAADSSRHDVICLDLPTPRWSH
jgi:hypothetical protein